MPIPKQVHEQVGEIWGDFKEGIAVLNTGAVRTVTAGGRSVGLGFVPPSAMEAMEGHICPHLPGRLTPPTRHCFLRLALTSSFPRRAQSIGFA